LQPLLHDAGFHLVWVVALGVLENGHRVRESRVDSPDANRPGGYSPARIAVAPPASSGTGARWETN
jgi:hypothetical protein